MLTKLTDNRNRPAKMAGVLIILLALSFYSYRLNRGLTAAWLTEIPEGAQRTLTHFQVVAVTPETMTVRIPDGRFPLQIGPVPKGVKVGDVLNLEVEKGGGQLHVVAVENRRLRVWKIWISLPVLLLIGWLLLREFRWHAATRCFVLRESAGA